MSDIQAKAAVQTARERGRRLSPLNQRRWQNFRANRRGFWALWIFLVLFGLSLIAELIANDRPLIASYKGEILFPVLIDYPEEKFGGFYAVTDYRDPVIQDEITANGWLIWPPIRYSYRTVNNDIPEAAPAKPSWLYSRAERCQRYPQGEADPNCTIGNWNWLGTDDQARDVLARVIYGFRISVLFGLILTLTSTVIGVTAGAVQGYFGGWVDLGFQRFIEIWSAIPVLYLILIVVGRAAAGLLHPARHHAGLLVGGAGGGGPRGVPARPQLRIRERGAGARGAERDDHAAATCCPTPWWRR